METFSYLGEKIKESSFLSKPFKHIYIENFIKEEHFIEIIKSNEIKPPANIKGDKHLINELYNKGFLHINFPGASKNESEYLRWRKNRNTLKHKHSACEGFGFVLRLNKIESPILQALNMYITSEEFNNILKEKFELSDSKLTSDGGIQKYLDGYEISPHPDTRRKALTFMVNINPSDNSENLDYHTRYMTLNNERKYINEFWEGNPEIDREWLPWEWLTTNKIQKENNSIVIFSPANDTFHAVKANYDHIETQRTQLYGNLWYNKSYNKTINWEKLDLVGNYNSRDDYTNQYNLLTKGFQKIKSIFNRNNKSLKRSIH